MKRGEKAGENGEISDILRKLLARRGVGVDEDSADFRAKSPAERTKISRESAREMDEFLHPNYAKTCYSPLLFPDMQSAVDRIKLAKKRAEKVTIYGDYDIDGMTATVVLWESLNRFGVKTDTYTPDRFSEGYGLNKTAVKKIADAGANLIITVDNGTLSFDEIAFAKTLGVDVIVTDHHSPHETLPDAVAVINPKIMPARFPEFYDEKFCLRRDVFREKLKTTEDIAEQKMCSTCPRGHRWTLGESCMICEPWRLIREDYNKFAVDFSRITNDEKRVLAKMFYPFCDPCGVGTAFILVRALQNESLKSAKKWAKFGEKNAGGKSNPYLIPLARGQEKWLLDLVALGTVCDIVGLVDENRANVFWGLRVMQKTRRPGLRALLAVAKSDIHSVNSETLGFVLGPRLNAAGRIDTADWALELLKLHDVKTAALNSAELKSQSDVNARALFLAQKLDTLNKNRRKIQDEVFAEAKTAVEKKFVRDAVLVVDGAGWHEGIIGIVAAKLLERFSKPTFVLSRGEPETVTKIDEKTGAEIDEKVAFAKGSGRSFGGFSMAAAIHNADEIIERGGGHLAAGGLTVRVDRIADFRESVQKMYSMLHLKNQEKLLIPRADVVLENFAKIDEKLLVQLELMEPFGHANEMPVFEFSRVKIVARRALGAENQHVKYLFADDDGQQFSAIAFSAAEKFTLEPIDSETGAQNFAKIRVNLTKNEWRGRVAVEGRLLFMELAR